EQLVEKTPLEALPPTERANARQRAVAAREIPLWLVARACGNLPQEKQNQTLASNLAARALEAARRQTDNTFYLTMIRERGELALSRGDKKAAIEEWGRMLEIVVTPPGSKIKKPATPDASAPAIKRETVPVTKERRRSSAMLPAKKGTAFRLV